ncbi:MAG: helix-turn-helix domain-containing protein [Deltaproteobacteria bacterium]|nr:MAG: helix-turn-helix domain-containing protein [Deltaproteobacteria bacterium]
MRADHPSGILGLHAAPARRQSPGGGPQAAGGWTQRAGPSIDWAKWMRELGARIRRVREFVGLSQEQLARLAGVSQGAVSRLEAGRGLATPLLVLMKINVPLLRALRGLDPSILNPRSWRRGADPPLPRAARAAAADVPVGHERHRVLPGERLACDQGQGVTARAAGGRR